MAGEKNWLKIATFLVRRYFYDYRTQHWRARNGPLLSAHATLMAVPRCRTHREVVASGAMRHVPG